MPEVGQSATMFLHNKSADFLIETTFTQTFAYIHVVSIRTCLSEDGDSSLRFTILNSFTFSTVLYLQTGHLFRCDEAAVHDSRTSVSLKHVVGAIVAHIWVQTDFCRTSLQEALCGLELNTTHETQESLHQLDFMLSFSLNNNEQ